MPTANNKALIYAPASKNVAVNVRECPQSTYDCFVVDILLNASSDLLLPPYFLNVNHRKRYWAVCVFCWLFSVLTQVLFPVLSSDVSGC